MNNVNRTPISPFKSFPQKNPNAACNIQKIQPFWSKKLAIFISNIEIFFLLLIKVRKINGIRKGTKNKIVIIVAIVTPELKFSQMYGLIN